MASQTNVVAIVGRVGADPELRHTNSGKAVANLRLANSRSVKTGDEWTDETSWFSVIIWEKLGELVAKKARKGDLVTVSGRLQERTWEDDGQKRSKVEIVAHTVEGEFQFRSSDVPTDSTPAAASANDDDIPF